MVETSQLQRGELWQVGGKETLRWTLYSSLRPQIWQVEKSLICIKIKIAIASRRFECLLDFLAFSNEGKTASRSSYIMMADINALCACLFYAKS